MEKFFGLKEKGTTVRTEVLAGFTTFLTMAYIIVVNPGILSTTGMDFGAVFVATCLAAAFGTLIMGLYANYPVALAPGMGLNAYFAFAVVGGMGIAWQAALGAVFLSGIIFLVISVLPIREWIINAIPKSLKLSISAGIGLFLAIIALKNAGIVVAHPATMVTLGDMTAWPAILAVLGFCIIAALDYRRVPGAVIIGILAVTVIGVLLGVSEFKGVIDLPPDPSPAFLQLDIEGALQLGLVTIVFAFLFVDFFDTAGTLIGVMHRAGQLDAQGRLPRLGRALVADSGATIFGALVGTSTTTSYIESAAGIKAGGRSGLTAVVVGLLFLACLLFGPLAETVPDYATAPALLFVACMMARGLAELDWEDVSEYAPGVVTAVAMPLTFSIANGLGFGFVTYAAIKVISGRPQECSIAVYLIAALFIVKLIALGA
ncbi:putative MFS transporter, AGZA family, xanthine/uracil permease [Tistlia consotensis]|uniref:Putative MFS transporter, AGZA family, xanthine/uracil permease n=1 Tax=Tistlia consotensis USBA 355 TaxID=560819 RepID=A0A1Y6BSW6_9PROT|nr:NCS2 family permease [Tistlia consotensis]SMF25213.1 putative MFS transporter, AGZA family, xanthine/uracil permease [Tistlia consotensis USBA 355]SNR59815.1 putative MFS transporter, AGZA family, xanthine/uracil permease [Tistlia consotensis]